MSHPHDSPNARLAARVRAVQAYAALSYDELARLTRIGESTLRRVASPTKPRGASLDEQWLIADACGVPRQWVEQDWPMAPTRESLEQAHELGHRLGELAPTGTTAERLAALEQYVNALLVEQERRRPELVPPRPQRPRRRKTNSGSGK